MKHTIALIIISIVCLSCRGVLFDEELSLTVSFISKLDQKATAGPIHDLNQCYDGEKDSIFFIPDKGYYKQGFIVKHHDTHFEIWYLDANGNIYGSDHFEITDSNEHEPNYLFDTIAGYPGRLLCVNYDGNTTRFNVAVYDYDYIYWYFGYEQELSYLISEYYNSFLGLDNNPSINGVYLSPVDGRVYILFSSDNEYYGTIRYFEASFSLSYGTDLIDPQCTHSGPLDYISLPDPVWQDVFYSHDAGENRSLMSYYYGSSYKTYTWLDRQSPQKISMSRPGKHLLSSGDIFTYQNGIARGYSLSGKELFVTGMGEVRFCYEYEDGNGTYQSLFSYTTVKQEDYDCSIDSATVYVYSIPSEDIADL
ncbi:MAG: hypothetical protein JW881_20640 [Spirochaetales bacterium]|nr:hypothetical protein [Spirochaetales bacterium]